QKVL
ncbi:hypothetical protein CSDA_01154, partial [Streptococcus dysgalactiae]